MGLRGEDIHRWIDGLFDAEGFDQLLRNGRSPDFDPYGHRKYRHCQEAAADAIAHFAGTYTPEQVQGVFECHLRDDYDGYLPVRDDFENGTFTEKYHENEEQAEQDRILNPAELAEYFKGKTYARHRAQSHKSGHRFRLKIVLPTVIAIVLFVASGFAFVVPAFRSSMLDHKKEMIRELTAAAASMIEDSARKQRDGHLSEAEAKRLAAAQVGAMRYGVEGKDYFWITDMHPRMVMHPYRPELVGTDLSDYGDAKGGRGKKLFVDFVRIVRAEGAGYSEYLWQWMDDASRMAPKISYVQGVPVWGWIVGTGVYVDDVERETDELTTNLILLFGVIGVLLALILLSVVWQSRGIEEERMRAEAGLHEAKERYRALVEGSKEGYILDVNGETIYSNRTLQQMLGLSEEAIAAQKVWQLLAPDGAGTDAARACLMKLADGASSSESFEAQLTASNGVVDVIISVSRIFFSEKNGHVVSFRPVQRTRVRSLLETFVGSTPHEQAAVLKELQESVRAAQIVQALNRLSLLVREMAEHGARPALLRHLIGVTFDASVTSLVKMALKDLGRSPVPFAFVSFGSNARHEMTTFSDQDNALIFGDVSAADKESVTRYFLKLGDRVCSELNKAGYRYCPGGVMAVNPKWCLPLSDWKRCFRGWIDEPNADSLLRINVFSDIRCVHGDQKLVDQLQAHIHQLTHGDNTFLMQFARNCLQYRAPAEVVSKARPGKSINLKECLKPIETFVRLYAVKFKVTAAGTINRLIELERIGALRPEVVEEIVYIFDYLWRMRFYNQLFSHADLKQIDDSFELRLLTEVERQNLHNVLSRISALQSKVCAEFLGMPLHMLPVD